MSSFTFSPTTEAPPRHALSHRERECLLWSARSKTYAETALILGLSFGSIKTYVDTSRYKLNAVTLPQATALAVAYGIITTADLAGRD
jgi:LuxR family transcriptional activator of conjugal transfer of Ti plasmids